jgi:hypothetical protein
MKKLMTMIAAVACLALWGCASPQRQAGVAGAAAHADDDKLVVVQDESSMEQTIERYLKDKHQLVINEKFLKPDDLYLELPMKGEVVPGMPAHRIQIDTQALNKDDNGRILERGVRITLLTGITVPADKWVAAMRAINDFNRRKTFSATYVDNDGEVILIGRSTFCLTGSRPSTCSTP